MLDKYVQFVAKVDACKAAMVGNNSRSPHMIQRDVERRLNKRNVQMVGNGASVIAYLYLTAKGGETCSGYSLHHLIT